MSKNRAGAMPQIGESLTRAPWLFLGFFLLYLTFTNAGYFDISDGEERFLAIRALLDEGSPKIIRQYTPEPYVPIYTLGPGISALPFIGYAEIVNALGITEMQRPQLQMRAILVGTAFYSALWMVLVAKLALLFTPSRRKALAIALLTGTATLVLPYSKSFQSENLVGLLVTTCVYCAIRFGREGRRRWLYRMGLALGAAFMSKNELAIAAIPLGIFVLSVRIRQGGRASILNVAGDAAVITLGALPGILVVLWYNWFRFGTVMASGYANYHFSHGFLSGLYIQWLSSGKGLMWYSPILFVGFYYLKPFWQKFPREAWLPLSWWVMMTLLYAKWVSPTGDTSLSARFMVSYLPFGVLPLVVMEWRVLPRAGKWLVSAFAVVSCWITLVCSLVPFPLYPSNRWNHAPNDVTERLRRIPENWYNPEYSPLGAYHEFLRSGMLDLWGVRFAPGEGALVIMPLWWLLAGGAITCLWLAWRSTAPAAGSDSFLRRNRIVLVPIVATCLFAALRLGYPKSESLRVTWHRPGWGTYNTLAQSISYKNIQDDRAFHVLLFEDISIEWRGKIFIPKDGMYQFELEAQNPLRLRIDDNIVAEIAPNPEQRLWWRKAQGEAKLSEGWHKIKVDYNSELTKGPLYVRWKPPGAAEFKSLSSAEFSQ